MITNFSKGALLLALFSFCFLMGCKDDEPDAPLANLEASIDVSSISFIDDMGAIDGRRIATGQSVTFSDGSTGEPDGWEWTFEGGPATSTEASPTVSWSEAVVR